MSQRVADEPAVIALHGVDLAFAPRSWPFAEERRQEIAAHFAAVQARQPKLWNGRILLLHSYALEASTLKGAALETDFASFLAWRDWGFPDVSMKNCFGMAALRAADDAFLLGVMGPHTANAGKSYFPSGTLDPGDVSGTVIDLEGSVRRELSEETGLDLTDMEAAPGWHAVFDGARIAVIKSLRSRERADALRAKILRYLAAETEPELSDIRVLRDPAEIDATIPRHTAAFLRHAWSAEC
jgi:8-oxo-dGTP pyrophosphatase MutT (NUDIX family)